MAQPMRRRIEILLVLVLVVVLDFRFDPTYVGCYAFPVAADVSPLHKPKPHVDGKKQEWRD